MARPTTADAGAHNAARCAQRVSGHESVAGANPIHHPTIRRALSADRCLSPHGGVAHSWTARPVPVPLPDVLPSRPPQDAITVHFREDGSRRSAPNSPMSVRTKPADAEEASSSSWWNWALPAPSGSNAAYRLPTLAEAIEGVNKAKLGLFASLESLDKADDGDGGRGAH